GALRRAASGRGQIRRDSVHSLPSRGRAPVAGLTAGVPSSLPPFGGGSAGGGSARAAADEVVAEVGEGRAAREGHGGGQLVLEDREHALDALLAADGQAPEDGAADEHGGGAEGQGLEDVGAGAEAAVEEDRAAAGDGGDDAGEG